MARLTRVTPRDLFWAPPPTALALAGDEVHVWRVDVRSAYARRNDLWRVLAKDERQKATDLLFEGDGKRSAAPLWRQLYRHSGLGQA